MVLSRPSIQLGDHFKHNSVFFGTLPTLFLVDLNLECAQMAFCHFYMHDMYCVTIWMELVDIGKIRQSKPRVLKTNFKILRLHKQRM